MQHPERPATRRRLIAGVAMTSGGLILTTQATGHAANRYRKRKKKRRIRGMVNDLQGMADLIRALEAMIERLGDIEGMEEFADQMAGSLADIESRRQRALRR